MMGGAVVRAINQDPPHPGSAHFAERYLLPRVHSVFAPVIADPWASASASRTFSPLCVSALSFSSLTWLVLRLEDDAGIRQRMKAIAQERRPFGLPTPACSAQAGGLRDQPQEAVPALSGGEAAVRRRGGRKRAIGTRAPMLVPMAPNDRWSLDFVSDQLTDGRRIRILTIVDDCTRECLALVADTSLSGIRVARELDRLLSSAASRRWWSATMAGIVAASSRDRLIVIRFAPDDFDPRSAGELVDLSGDRPAFRGAHCGLASSRHSRRSAKTSE